MSNGVIFGTKNSVTDWDLLMTSKQIGKPEARTNYIEIPGRDGTLDLTESLGEIKYNDRTLTFEFDLFNPSNFWNTEKEISNYLNGKKLKITLEQDPNYYYLGRCKVSSSLTKNVGHFTIECTCEPYKYKQNVTTITNTVTTGGTYNYSNDRKSVVPTLTLSAAMNLEFNGTSYSIGAGTNKVLGINFKEGINTIKVTSGSGTLTVSYQEGSL